MGILQDKVIYVDIENPEKSLTYSQVKYAAGLKRESDLQYGDVVAVCSPTQIDYFVVLHGAVCTGGVLAAIDQDSSPEMIASDLDLVQAKIVVTHEDKINKVPAAAKIVELRLKYFVDDTILSGDELATPYSYTTEQIMKDPAYLYFTSGTTGRKKGDFADFKILAYTEFHHASSLFTIMHMAIYYGRTAYIMAHYNFRSLCEVVEKDKINFAATQPYIVSALAKDSVAHEYDLSSQACCMLWCCVGQVYHCYRYRAIRYQIINAYDMTEVLGLFETNLGITFIDGLGYLAPGYAAKLVDEEGKEVPNGDMGELGAKGPTVTPGYYRNPEATAAAIDPEGYLHTGDLLRCDGNGMFFYVDRSKDLIKYHLIHIYPIEIENVLMTHSKIADCAAIGLYYPELVTEFPHAYVNLVDGEKYSEEVERELREYANSRLSNEKQLRDRLVIGDSFLRTASGKIQSRVLCQEAHEQVSV